MSLRPKPRHLKTSTARSSPFRNGSFIATINHKIYENCQFPIKNLEVYIFISYQNNCLNNLFYVSSPYQGIDRGANTEDKNSAKIFITIEFNIFHECKKILLNNFLTQNNFLNLELFSARV